MTQSAQGSQDELTRRHRAALMSVVATFIFTLVLAALALSEVFIKTPHPDLITEWTLRIAIIIFGSGVIVLRRVRFSPMRLQDIASLRGPSGLLATLQKTTTYTALIAGAIAIMGFFLTLMSGVGTDMIVPALIALAVLIYAYPRLGAWRRVLQLTARPGVEDNPTALKGTLG